MELFFILMVLIILHDISKNTDPNNDKLKHEHAYRDAVVTHTHPHDGPHYHPTNNIDEYIILKRGQLPPGRNR